MSQVTSTEMTEWGPLKFFPKSNEKTGKNFQKQLFQNSGLLKAFVNFQSSVKIYTIQMITNRELEWLC